MVSGKIELQDLKGLPRNLKFNHQFSISVLIVLFIFHMKFFLGRVHKSFLNARRKFDLKDTVVVHNETPFIINFWNIAITSKRQ